MKKVFCLGLHKTGSTSLQHFLLNNQIKLAQAGILVPPITPEQTARFLSELLGHDHSTRPAHVNEYMGHNALAYQMIAEAVEHYHLPPVHAPMGSVDSVLHMCATLAKQIAAKALILCSEDFSRASLMDPNVPQRLAQRFGTDEVTLFCVVRRPDEAISAWQSQMLRFANPFPALVDRGLSDYLGSVHLEYRAALEPWLKCFPKAELVILPYDVVLKQGGTVSSFLSLNALDMPQGLEAAPRANPSLPHALIEIARRAFDALPQREAVSLYTYLMDATPRLDLPRNHEVDLLGVDARDQLIRAFADTHHWLSQLTRRIPFFEDYEDMKHPRAMSGSDASAKVLPNVQKDAADQKLPDALQSYLQRLDFVE